MEEVEKSAASVEEAIDAALADLGVTEQQARIEILQEPRSGFLGLNQQPAIVRVTATRPRAGGAETEAEASIAREFLDELLWLMGLAASVEANEVEGSLFIDVSGGDEPEAVGILIGKRGQTLDALQELVRSVVQRRTGERSGLVVDVEDYRKRRQARLAEQVKEAAQSERKTGRQRALPPMTPSERKAVHELVAGLGGLESVSQGQDPQRRIVIRRRP